MMNIHKHLQKVGIESYVVWGRGRKALNNNEIYMNDKAGVYYHALYTRITDKTGFASKRATKKLIKKLEFIKPDIVHLHNIHGYYINIELLFEYFKKNDIKVVWTLHDCWSFTGHCAYFDSVGCNKWKTQCEKCPLIKEYPKSIIDNSKWNYLKKMQLFNCINLHIVTPSKWLANLVKESYLKDYPVFVINNGINTNIFKYTNSNFKEKYNLIGKKIILGVASTWDKRKGLDDFIKLSKVISDDYKIVLVGLTKKQMSDLPKNILGLERTKNVDELVEIYSASDILFNPTREDNYPTVNLEALSCGIPVVTYDTGGSPEVITNNNGLVTTFDYFVKKYSDIINKKYDFLNECDFSLEKMTKQYEELYKNI